MRTYGKWVGNPEWETEDETRCIKEVTSVYSWTPYQCSRKRGYGKGGLYCKQHAKIYPEGGSE